LPALAADERVHAGAHAVRQEVQHRPRHRAERDEVVGLEPFDGKPANREQRAIHRQRRHDGVDARPVGQARIHHRRAVVDPAADAAHNAIDDAQQMAIVLERGGHLLELAAPLHEHVLVGVDENVADARVAQSIERSQTEHW
jgi:hypothetical protein